MVYGLRSRYFRHTLLTFPILKLTQEAIKSFFVKPANHFRLPPAAFVFGVCKDELEADAIAAPPDSPGVDGDGPLSALFPLVCDRQRHQNQGAGVPALLGNEVKSRRTNILDVVRLGSGAGPIIGG